MKKLIALALVFALALSLMTFVSAEEEPMKIVWAFSAYDAHEFDEIPADSFIRVINEKFDVEIIPYATNYLQNAEQFTTRLGSGDLPDVWYDWNTNKWDEQGIIRHIPYEWVEEYMPYCVEHVFNAFDKEGLAFAKRYAADGQLKGIPAVTGEGACAFIRVYRQDWLDKLGLEVPTTMEEFTEVIRAFTEDDPDGNGIDDTYGICGNTLGIEHGFSDIMASFGLTSTPGGYKVDEDGNVQYSWATENAKAAFEYLADIYAKGYIYPESVTQDYWEGRQMFGQGIYGTTVGSVDHLDPTIENSYTYHLLRNNPDAKYSFGGAMVGFDGSFGSHSFTADLGWSLTFAIDASDELVCKVLEIVDYCATPEGYLANLGTEGVDYHFNENGKFIMDVDAATKYEKALNSTFPVLTSDETVDYYFGTKGEKVEEVTIALAQTYALSCINGFALEKCNEAGLGKELFTISKNFFWDCMMGKKTVEADWDAYIAELEADGLAEAVEEANEIYHTQVARDW